MEESKQIDHLTTPEKQNIENPYIVISESSEETTSLEIIKKSVICPLITPYFIMMPIISISLLFSLQLYKYKYWPVLLIPLLPILLLLFIFKKKLILRKSNKQLTVYEQNYLFCKKKYEISLENINAQIKSTGLYKGCGKFYYLSSIFIYGIDQNKINFDTNYIKRTPCKFFYTFTNCVIDFNTLSNFLGINSQNKIIDEINLYVPNSKEEKTIENQNPNLGIILNRLKNQDYNQFVKLSEHYYCFFSYNFVYEKKSNENFQRIDWIYSENYDQIFIGIVKNDSSYINKFTFITNTINKYILELKGDKYQLKVLFNDETGTDLCHFKNDYKVNNYYSNDKFKTLLYFLNGQINKINNRNNNGSGIY